MPNEVTVMEAGETVAAEPEAAEPIQTEGDSGRLEQQPEEKQDGRRTPDGIRRHIADLRRQADAITDPTEKKAALDRIKLLYDTTGKARGYEEQFPTVREAREVRALIESVGGREGVQRMQSIIQNAEAIDGALESGDQSIVPSMFEEAPEGMPKLVGPIADHLEKSSPEKYQQFIAPRAVRFMDSVGFPLAFDRMVQLYESGKTQDAQAIRDELVKWVIGNRQQGQQATKQADPETEKLRKELEELRNGNQSREVDQAYNSVVDHAGPAIDKVAKPQLAKFGLTADEYKAFRGVVWDHLQSTRNGNDTYKTVAPAKQKQGYNQWVQYAKRWTDDNVDASVRAVLKMPPWNRLAAGTKTAPVVKSPTQATIQAGKEPSAAEIDYGPKGLAAARKAGFKDLADMLLSGQAPLKAGGIRKWR